MHRAMRSTVFVLLASVLAAPLVGTSTVRAAQSDSVTVTFQQVGNSGVSGTATLTAEGDQTRVVLSVTGVTGDHPDHIHRSTCADPEPSPTYPLDDVVLSQSDATGRSETLVDVPLSKLLTQDFLILIHKSHEEIDVYLACADIELTGPMPNTGVGSAIDSANDRMTEALLAIAAVVAALAGLWLHHGTARKTRVPSSTKASPA